MNFLGSLERQSKPILLLVGFTIIVAIGIVDFLTGYELSLSVFFVLPISLITWLTGPRIGLAASLTSAFIWLGADIATGHRYSTPFFLIWNTLIRLAFFIIITVQLAALRRTIQREGELARIDYLTGAVNSRFFYDLAQMEINRFHRHPHQFTLAYIDLDNFKSINDLFGHATGDQVLQTVVSYVKKHVRKTDVFARLGGDEFALLLPETNQEAACVVLSKLYSGLLDVMQQNNWPITFSIGVLTCTSAPATIDELVKRADDLMYSVKRNNKNAIKYSIYTG